MLQTLRQFFCIDHKFLVWNMVSRNIKLRYRKSTLGYFWTLLVPLSTAAIYYFLFKMIFKVQTPNFAAFITVGILVWTFFSSTLKEGMTSVISGFSILLQVNIPLHIFPLTTALSNFATLVFAIPAIVIVCILSSIPLSATALFVFYYMLLLFLQAYSFGLFLSISVIYLRDLTQAISPLLQIWMYGSPILYQINMIPEKYVWILFANPVGKIFSGIHNTILRGAWPTPSEIFVPLAWTILITTSAVVFSSKLSKNAVEKI